MKAILRFVASISLSTPVIAKQPPSPPIKMLSPTECALIEKRPAGDYMVNGTITRQYDNYQKQCPSQRDRQ
jgi:hypothetical protein